MHWERLSEDVYVFTSDRYAQVTASLIVSGTIGVVIDTLPFPQETSQIALFARRRCPDGVRYVVYTQHQADHTYGAFLFPRAEVISHTLCRAILLERGYKALEQAKALNHELDLVRLRIPNLTFDHGTLSLRLPGKTLDLFPTPGHTPDAISVILQEEKILFAGDTVMAIPTIAEGDVA
jgi:glyoxylase-like metal-dependent hydrolase (beta-lactamase superfamily II)